MKKRVLLVTFSDNADHQGAIFGLYEKLKETEDVCLLAISSPKVPIEKSEKTWLVNCPKRPGICKGTFNVPLLLKLIHRIRKKKFDVVYFESLHTWNLPIMALCGRKTHVFHVIHDVIPHEGDRQAKMVNLMNKAVCSLADTVVLRNQIYVDYLLSRYKISAEHVKTLNLWRKFPEYTEPSHSGRVLFFGRINAYKGADNLLEIVRECPEIRFDVVGRADPQTKDVVDRLAGEQNVKLCCDYVSNEDMRNAFIGADWVILPYNSATQSGVILDAYQYSRPVIAFNVGAIAEQLEDGVSGYLVEAGDNHAFAEKLKEAVSVSSDELNMISMEAYRYGIRKYSVECAAERFLTMIYEN